MLEQEDRKDGKRKQEAGAIEELIQKQKQMHGNTAAELGLLQSEIINQITKMSKVQELVTLK